MSAEVVFKLEKAVYASPTHTGQVYIRPYTARGATGERQVPGHYQRHREAQSQPPPPHPEHVRGARWVSVHYQHYRETWPDDPERARRQTYRDFRHEAEYGIQVSGEWVEGAQSAFAALGMGEVQKALVL